MNPLRIHDSDGAGNRQRQSLEPFVPVGDQRRVRFLLQCVRVQLIVFLVD